MLGQLASASVFSRKNKTESKTKKEVRDGQTQFFELSILMSNPILTKVITTSGYKEK